MEINVRNKNTYSGEGEYIGRPSILGNPFKVTKNQSRSVAIYRYSSWMVDVINDEGIGSVDHPQIMKELDRLFSILVQNQKLNLICHCSPKACHGEIIKQLLLNKYHTGEYLVNGRFVS